MSRLPQATREAFPDDLKYVWDRLAGDTSTTGDAPGPANIFKAMGNNPQILRSYLRLGNGLWAHCGLDVATRELVILRAAYVQNSAYEWHQHVRIGRTAGLSDERINDLRNWRESKLFSPAERALFLYVDAIAASDHPGQAVFAELAKHFDNATIVGIGALAPFYFATAKFLAAMEVETEGPFIGWTV